MKKQTEKQGLELIKKENFKKIKDLNFSKKNK